MDENFARAMLATDFPKEHGLGGFRLPYPALWVSAPPVLKVMNHQTGLHDLDGFYLAEDWVPSRKKLMSIIGKECSFAELDDGLMQVINQRYADNLKSDPMSVLERAILVVMVGKPKVPVEVHRVDIEGMRVELPAMDDALISFWALTEDSFQAEENEEFLRLVFNLLIAIQSDYIEEEKITPQQPRGSRRKAKAIRKGESFAPYSVIRLGKRAKTARSAASGPDTAANNATSSAMLQQLQMLNYNFQKFPTVIRAVTDFEQNNKVAMEANDIESKANA
jgi:hypothetical protein